MFDDEAYKKFVEQFERPKVSLKSELDIYLEDFILKVATYVEFDIID